MLIAIDRLSLCEWDKMHPILQEIAIDWSAIWRRFTEQPVAIVTGIYRSHERTVQIYEAAGKEPPASSVHECLPERFVKLSGIRGIDFSIRMIHEPDLDIDDRTVEEAVEEINGKWRYHAAGSLDVALFHRVSGPHVHLQCRPGAETGRR